MQLFFKRRFYAPLKSPEADVFYFFYFFLVYLQNNTRRTASKIKCTIVADLPEMMADCLVEL